MVTRKGKEWSGSREFTLLLLNALLTFDIAVRMAGWLP